MRSPSVLLLLTKQRLHLVARIGRPGWSARSPGRELAAQWQGQADNTLVVQSNGGWIYRARSLLLLSMEIVDGWLPLGRFVVRLTSFWARRK